MAEADTRFIDCVGEATPQLIAGVSVRDLPIVPEEAFVLSCIDGVSSEADIAAVTNLGLEQVSRIIARLVSLGAVAFDAQRPAPGAVASDAQSAAPGPARSLRPPLARSGAYRIGPIVEAPQASASIHPAAADEPAAELAEEVDLEPEQKRQLLELYQRLESLNHYELLGIEALADDKAIRTAYYELVRVFHPD